MRCNATICAARSRRSPSPVVAGRLRDARRRDAEVAAKAAAMLKASFKRRGPGEARPPRPGRDAASVQRVRRQGAAEGRRRADREGQPRDDQVAGRRQVRRRLEERREDRAGGPRQAVLRRSEGPGRRQLLRLPSARAAGALVRHDRAAASTSSASCAATATTCASTRTARSTTPRRTRACSNMPRFGHKRHPDRAADQGRRRAADGSRSRRSTSDARARVGTRADAALIFARDEPPRIPAALAAAAAAAGFALDARAARANARRRARSTTLRALRQRAACCTSPTATRSCCRCTSASRTSISASAPRRGEPPHLVGEALLKHFGIAPGTRDAHAFTYLDFAHAARTYGQIGGFAHLATLVKRLKADRARRAAARRRRHVAGLGDGAVDEGPGHGRRAEAARRRRHDRPLGIHATAPSASRKSSTSDFAGKIDFVAQNVKTADFGDPVFPPYVMRDDQRRAGRDHRPGVSVHADRQSALLRRRSGRSASRKRSCRRSSTRRAARARRSSCSCRTTAWTSISSSRRACTGIDAILGGHTHDGVPQPIVVANARRQDARHQRRQQRQVPRGARPRRQARQGRRFPLPAAARVRQSAARGSRRWRR